MKKLLNLALAAFIITASTIVSASPITMTITVQCPIAVDQSNMLSNYGDYIAGYGVERIDGQGEYPIYFKSNGLVKNIPANLEHYNNNGVKYDSTNGEVTCTYQSIVGDPSFDVSYPLTNAKGGKVSVSTPDKITIFVPFAFKA